MAKVLLIGNNNLYLMPFLKKYENICKEKSLEYDVVFWNKSGLDSIEMPNFIPYQKKSNNYVKPFEKITDYIGFRRFVKQILKKNNYDVAVVMTSQCYIAIWDLIDRFFGKNYIFDYRDVTYEKHILFKKIIKHGIFNSACTAFSSPGFLNNFPSLSNNQFCISHNDKFGVFKPLSFHKENEKFPIKLSFWGMIRQVEYTQKFIRTFGDDAMFEINYYGEGYVDQIKNGLPSYSNVFFHGAYKSLDEIREYSKDTDVLINCYDNNSNQFLALTVKLYDGLLFGLPMVIAKGSYMAKYLENNGCPFFCIDFDNPNLKKDFIYWYRSLRQEVVNEAYQKLINRIIEDDLIFKEKISNVLEGRK